MRKQMKGPVRAEENLKLSYGGPNQGQASAPTNGLKLYLRAVIESETRPSVVQLKKKP